MNRYASFDRLAAALECTVWEQEPMSRHTTFRIGGPVDRLAAVRSREQLCRVLALLEAEEIPWMVLGNGSNLLVTDRGVRGVALVLDGDFKKIELLPEGLGIRAGAGASLAGVCTFAREHSLSGLEFAWGIPGSVGGAAYMNAGAYGGEMRDVVRRVLHCTPGGESLWVSGEELAFDYRRSRYTGGRDVILAVELDLERGRAEDIAGKMEELMGRRKDKQPYDMPSAGSVFKRPASGYAAALIDECGLKGKTVGGAQVSPKHAGFIVNCGGASCRDVLELVELVRRTVAAEKGVELECEIRLVGE